MIPREILKKIRQIELRTTRLVTETLGGQYHSVFKGQGMNFEEVREYQPGDEVRSIDWNVTARMNHPFVKKFVEERELTLMLVVDLSGSGLFGSGEQSKRELAAEIASVLAFSAIRNNDKVGLILFTEEVEKYIPPKKGRRHVLRVIREILCFPAAPGAAPISMRRWTCSTAWPAATPLWWSFRISSSSSAPPSGEGGRRGPAAIWFRPRLGPRTLPALRQANRRHDVIAIQVVDRFEMELPALGRLMLTDAETGEMIEINTHDARKRRAFAERRASHQAELLRLLRSANIDAIEVRTGEPYAAALGQFFETREKRRRHGMSMNTNSALIIPAQPPAATNAAAPLVFQDGAQAADRDSQRWLWVFWIAADPGAAGRRVVGLALLAQEGALPCRCPPVPPHVRARRRLEQALALISEPKPFSIAVSGAIRAYLEERFDFHAPERTTEEFLYELQGTKFVDSATQKQSLADFLAGCDLIKFAKYEPTEIGVARLARRRPAPCQRNRAALVPAELQSLKPPPLRPLPPNDLRPSIRCCCCCSLLPVLAWLKGKAGQSAAFVYSSVDLVRPDFRPAPFPRGGDSGRFALAGAGAVHRGPGAAAPGARRDPHQGQRH